jgi:hypothetical protein
MSQFTAFSILLFTESTQSSSFFLKKNPPLMRFQCQQVNRKRSGERHSLKKYQYSVPHPFAHFANGWESINLKGSRNL